MPPGREAAGLELDSEAWPLHNTSVCFADDDTALHVQAVTRCSVHGENPKLRAKHTVAAQLNKN